MNIYKSKMIKMYFCTIVTLLIFYKYKQLNIMVDRIKQIMELYQLTPASLSEQIGINRSSLAHIFSGRNQPSLEIAKKILHCYPDIKTEWLIMGVGEMIRNVEEKELIKKIQIGKQQPEPTSSEPDLFSTPLPSVISSHGESHRRNEQDVSTQITNSREVEKEEPAIVTKQPLNELLSSHPATTTLIKIVFFYSDNSFEVFHQNARLQQISDHIPVVFKQ